MIDVVIAEDDPMVAHINSQYITQLPNMRVKKVFSNGWDAWEYISRKEPDLLILDVYMPKLSGLEVLRKLRANNMATEVIMVTAANEISAVDQALKLGIVDYLIKPFEYERFRQAVMKFLQRIDLLRTGSTLDQQAVDHLLQSMGTKAQENAALQKGLNGKTAQYIFQHLTEHAQGQQTCDSLSKSLGLSKVTIRRYLNYFIEIGMVFSTIDYETGGRPSMRYHCKIPSQPL